MSVFRVCCMCFPERLAVFAIRHAFVFSPIEHLATLRVDTSIKQTQRQLDQLSTIYYNAQALNEAARGAGAENTAKAVNTKYSFAVDHILPLQPEYVIFKGIKLRPYIGLHAPWNLQIIDALDNLSKLNRA